MEENIINRIKAARTLLPKKQRQLCNYIDANLLEASTMTVAELADRVGVGTTTVIRMVDSLGYDSYNAFKRDLRHAVVSNAGDSYSAYWDIRQNRFYSNREGVGKRFSVALEEGISLLHSLNNPQFFAQIEAGVEAILAAKRIYILGLRSSLPMALNLDYLLRQHLDNIYQLSVESEFLFDTIARLNQQDLVIALAFRPYIKKTGDTVRLCHKIGIPVLLITSQLDQNTLKDFASLAISVSKTNSFISIVPLIMTAVLIEHEVGRRTKGKAQQYLQRLDRILLENDLTEWEK